ncbi:MAG TPA: hypothetical protein VJP05_02350 [Acidimicrobiia bacterium]|nr:hypothetical protein [Acidimicrobiia bacterium]
MKDTPEFHSSEEMIREAREDLVAPLDEAALMRPVTFDDPANTMPAENSLFETSKAPPRNAPTPRSRPTPIPAKRAVVSDVKARAIVAIVIALTVLAAGIMAAVANAGR